MAIHLEDKEYQGTQARDSGMHFSGEGTDFPNNWHQNSLKLHK